MAAPPLRIRRHDSPLGRWEIVERPPDPRLAGLVRSYAGFDERNATPIRRREVPGTRIPMIIGFGPPLWVDGERRSSFVAGLHDRPSITEYRGESRGIQVDLSPLGARRFLGVPMHELTTRVVPLADLLGTGVETFIESLAETRSWEARFAALDDAILRHVADVPLGAPEIAWAWRELERTGGRVPIASLAEGTGWSARRLITSFRDEVGVTPKLAARILRFERVVARIQEARGHGWADIAYDCGYYDQAHLNRDFREFAGTTPTAFVAALLPDGFGVGVNSVQDTPARAA
jgi:AraC-like DNA-binding protein